METFPFGEPVIKVEQEDKSPKKVFILGVYASAVHTRWISNEGKTIINALAVASEPEIFWTGNDAKKIIDRIKLPAEAGQRAEAGMTGFPVTENAIMEPPTYLMVGRLLLNAIPEPKKESLIKEVPVDDAILESYVGKYELMPGFILTITKYDSQLKVKATGQGEGPIIPISQNVFVIKGVDDAQLIFNINEAGEVESMTLQQNGMDNICKKLAD